MKKFISVALVFMLVAGMIPCAVFAQNLSEETEEIFGFSNETAHQFVARMGTGWNLGNTFDATAASNQFNATAAQIPSIETRWIGGSTNVTTKSLIQAIAEQGFDTIRIPVTWHKVANPNGNWEINAHWMARIKQVVDWALEENMFVILNTHHENTVMDMGSGNAGSSSHAGNIFIRNIWRQVAQAFEGYDERLIFAGLNEPRHEGGTGEWNGGTETVRANVNHLNQLFVDTVRASTCVRNQDRFLMVPTVAAGSNATSLSAFRVPLDLARHRKTMPGNVTNVGMNNTAISSNKIIFSVHTYSPFNWAHDGLATYSMASITTDLNRVRDRANQLGLPVILGEWGSVEAAIQTRNPFALQNAAGQNTRDTQRVTHASDYIRESRSRGMVSVWWDNAKNWDRVTATSSVADQTFGIITRRAPHTITSYNQNVINAIMSQIPRPTTYTVTVTDSHADNSGAGRYQSGATVTIRAGTRPGWDFAGWTVVSGGPISFANANNATTTFAIPARNVAVRANWQTSNQEAAVYDMQTTTRVATGGFTTFSGAGGLSGALATSFAPLRRSGGSATTFTAVDGATRSISVTNRGGISQAVQLVIGGTEGLGGTGAVAIPIAAGNSYRLEYTATFPAGGTPRIRIESSGGSAVPVAQVPGGVQDGDHVRVDGTAVAAGVPFTHSVTLSHAQLVAIGSRSVSLSATSTSIDINYANVRIIQVPANAATYTVTSAVHAAQTTISPTGAQSAGTAMTVTLTAPANQRIAGTNTTIAVTGAANFNMTVAADRRTATGTFNMPSSSGTITFSAAFENIVSYTVTFALNGGNIGGNTANVVQSGIAQGANATPPANPTRLGFVFNGWDGSHTNVTSNRTLTAQWLRLGAVLSGGTGNITSADAVWLARSVAKHAGFEMSDRRIGNLRGLDRDPTAQDVMLIFKFLVGYDIHGLIEQTQ